MLEIRLYLLGRLEPGHRFQQVEERMLTQDDYYEELLIVEDEMIDLYLAGALSPDERESFERHFLKTPERRRKLNFARTLRRYVAGVPRPAPPRRRPWTLFQPLFASPARAALVALVLICVSLLVWRLVINNPNREVDRGLAALQAAYRGGRPVEARIAGWDYAPWSVTRGGAQPLVDATARARAERLLLDADHERPGPATKHALGRLHLAAREYDRAIPLFEAALKSDADNARLHNDLGVALFEKGRSGPPEDAAAQDLEALARGVEHFDRAVELDGRLSEARFNRALAYQHMLLRRQAEAAWKEYLQSDPDSPWADEARRHLKLLEETGEAAPPPGDKAVHEFLGARRAGDDDAAWKVLSQNHTSTGNAVTNGLLDSLFEPGAAGEPLGPDDALPALSYLARLEQTRAGDRYTSDLLGRYARTPPRLRPLLGEARRHVKAGDALFTQSKYAEAAGQYARARRSSARAGDDVGSVLAEYRLALCDVFLPDLAKARLAFERLAAVCAAREYRWLHAHCLYRLAHVSFDGSEYTRAVDESARALAAFERAGDSNGVLRCLVQLADAHQALNRAGQSFDYLRRGLALAGRATAEPMQRWGLLVQLAFSLSSMRLHAAALLYHREALSLAVETGRPLIISRSYGYVGAAYAALKLYAEALGHAERAFETGRGLPEVDAAGKEIMANASQQLGDILRLAGECGKAVEAYDRSIRLYGDLNVEYYSYAAHKGKLLCLEAGPDAGAAAAELETVLSLFERYRSKITAESHRNSFFDEEQSVYDLAIRHEFVRMRDPARAFEKSEVSRARSLWDQVSRGAEVLEKAHGPDLHLPEVARPLSLAGVQAGMPDGAQILQYAVLDDRLLIWVVTKSGVRLEEVGVGSGPLAEKVSAYLKSASRPPAGDDAETAARAADLYRLLIAPAERLVDKSKFLCVVPDKALHYLPFGALVSPATGRYLVEDYDFGVAPSSSIFVAVSAAAAKKAGAFAERLLSVGDPSFSRAAFPSLPRLPSAAREAEAVSQFYATRRVLLREQAREQALKSEMGKADVAHLALHYVVNGRSEMLSGFALAPEPAGGPDGFLQSYEVYGMRLPRTRLVVLSACQTGIEQEYAGEGAVGVTRPFLVAGVPAVVASLWPVDSDASAELMTSFHRHRVGDGLTVTQALRRAQVEMARGPDARRRHPFYWAPFVAVGGHTRF